MLRHRLPLALVLSCVAGCDGGVSVDDPGNPIPVVVGVEPPIVVPVAPETTVRVHGIGFAEGATTRWNGAVRTSVVESETVLYVTVPFEDLASAGSATLSVENPDPGGGESDSIEVTVGNPLPVTDSVRMADSTTVLTEGVTLRVRGQGYAAGARARWNGIALPTSVVSSTLLLAEVGDHLLRAGGTAEVTVLNPPPGGGASAARAFTWSNPVPTLDSIDPVFVSVQTVATLTFRGSGFSDGAAALYGAEVLMPTSVSPTQLVVRAPASLHAAPGSIDVRVQNPAPGGGVSNAISIPVWAFPPRVDEAMPPHSEAGAPPFTLELRGDRFWPSATVTWNGSPIAANVADSTRILVDVEEARVAQEGIIEVVVTNPTPGGVTSFDYTVMPQVPATVTAFSPRFALVGDSPFDLQVRGDHFAAGAVVTWNGATRAAEVVSPTLIEVPIDEADLASAGVVEVRVQNPVATDPAVGIFSVRVTAPETRVVYETWGSSSLVASELDGQESQVLVDGGGVRDPDASPVDATVAYVAYQDGTERIFVVDPDGSIRKLLPPATLSFEYELSPRFSADGLWIYFTVPSGVYRARTDGSAHEVVLDDPDYFSVAPSWLGDRLTIIADHELRVLDLPSGRVTSLGVEAVSSRWSPGDLWIAYVTPQWQLRAIRPDGSGDHAVTTLVEFGARFDWSPSGEHIVGPSPAGDAQLVDFASGQLLTAPDVGQIGSIAWFDSP